MSIPRFEVANHKRTIIGLSEFVSDLVRGIVYYNATNDKFYYYDELDGSFYSYNASTDKYALTTNFLFVKNGDFYIARETVYAKDREYLNKFVVFIDLYENEYVGILEEIGSKLDVPYYKDAVSGHHFPKIKKLTAEKLFEKVELYDASKKKIQNTGDCS